MLLNPNFRIGIAIIVAVGMLGLAGCGSTPTPPPPPSDGPAQCQYYVEEITAYNAAIMNYRDEITACQARGDVWCNSEIVNLIDCLVAPENPLAQAYCDAKRAEEAIPELERKLVLCENSGPASVQDAPPILEPAIATEAPAESIIKPIEEEIQGFGYRDVPNDNFLEYETNFFGNNNK